MRWLWQRAAPVNGHHRLAAPLSTSSLEVPHAEETVALPRHSSLGLRAALASLRANGAVPEDSSPRPERPLVLDLGPSVGANVEALASRGWRVQVSTLDLPLGSDGWGAEAQQLGSLLEEALGQPASPVSAPTLILFWDRVNYLDLKRLPLLVRALEPWCGNPTHALALVATHKEQPSQPGTFRIENEDTLSYRWMENGDPRIQSPRHRPAQLEKAMQPFRVVASWILRNGIQECLLRRDL